MIAYNKNWLDNLYIQHQAAEDVQKGNLLPDEGKLINERYPSGFYKPGAWVRVGLFALTVIIVLFSAGLLSFMFASSHMIDSYQWIVFLGLATYAALEAIISFKHHYQSGVDDALLFMVACFLTGAFVWFTGSLDQDYQNPHYLSISAFVCMLTLYFTWRFTDLLMSAVSCLAFFNAIYFLWQKAGAIGLSTMPFMLMLTAAALFLGFSYLSKKIAAYYKYAVLIVEVISLCVFYAAGNYFVVDYLRNSSDGFVASSHPGIPFGFFFWCWTILLPIAYLTYGIARKNPLLLRLGLLLIAAAVLTVRYYHHIIPADLACTLGGALLIGAVYLINRKLKTSKHGFIAADDKKTNLLDAFKIESLVTAETLGHAPVISKEPESRFGGGDFGGGGASGNF